MWYFGNSAGLLTETEGDGNPGKITEQGPDRSALSAGPLQSSSWSPAREGLVI